VIIAVARRIFMRYKRKQQPQHPRLKKISYCPNPDCAYFKQPTLKPVEKCPKCGHQMELAYLRIRAGIRNRLAARDAGRWL
jgi:hypothetical protein